MHSQVFHLYYTYLTLKGNLQKGIWFCSFYNSLLSCLLRPAISQPVCIDGSLFVQQRATSPKSQSPYTGSICSIPLCDVTFARLFLHIFHQMIWTKIVIMEPIQQILLLANLDLDDHPTVPLVELSSHIYPQENRSSLTIGHAVGLASSHNSDLLHPALEMSQINAAVLANIKIFLAMISRSAIHAGVFLHPCSFSIKNRGRSLTSIIRKKFGKQEASYLVVF